MKTILFIACFILLVNGLSAQNALTVCVQKNFVHMDSLIDSGKNPWTEWTNCVKGKYIPAFSATTMSGQKIGTEQLKGKVVVINFWSIACPPCLAEMPGLNKLVSEYRDKNVVFLAITYESLKRMNEDFFPKFKFDFNLVINAQSIIDTFGGTGYPTTYVVDKNGKIADAWIGELNGKPETAAYLRMKPVIDGLLK